MKWEKFFEEMLEDFKNAIKQQYNINVTNNEYMKGIAIADYIRKQINLLMELSTEAEKKKYNKLLWSIDQIEYNHGFSYCCSCYETIKDPMNSNHIENNIYFCNKCLEKLKFEYLSYRLALDRDYKEGRRTKENYEGCIKIIQKNASFEELENYDKWKGTYWDNYKREIWIPTSKRRYL